MKSKRYSLIILATILLVSVFVTNASATVVNGRILSKGGNIYDDSVSIPLGTYSCYYNFQTSTHKLSYNLDVDALNLSAVGTSYCKMNYSIKVLNESYSTLYSLYQSSSMTETQFMLYVGTNFSGTYKVNYSGAWTTNSDSKSGSPTISENKLVYLHHVFYSKVGNTYYGSLTFNAAFAVPSGYTGLKYLY